MSWLFRSFGISLMLVGGLVVALGVASVAFLFFFAFGSSAAITAMPFSFPFIRTSAEDISAWGLALFLLAVPLGGLALAGFGNVLIRLSRTKEEKRRAAREPQDSWPD